MAKMAWPVILYLSLFCFDACFALPSFIAKHHSHQSKTAKTVVPLKKASANPASSKNLFSKRPTVVHSTPLQFAEEGMGYFVEIQFGNKTFPVLFDTGSSDLWLATSDFQCIGDFNEPVPQSECAIGPGFSGTLTGGPIANQNFNITYGDGEFLTGTLGYEDVTLAGVTVNNQEVALVDYGFWLGDNETSGLIGFAYPLLTSAFQGTNPKLDNVNTTAVHYNPFFFNAFGQGTIAPVFSLALSRSAPGSDNAGELALGGLPSVAANKSFTTTQLEIVQLGRLAAAASQFSYYTVCIDGVTFTPAGNNGTNRTSSSGHKSHGSNYINLDRYAAKQDLTLAAGQTAYVPDRIPMIVDSGTTLLYLPDKVAETINAAFSPPAYFSYLYGIWVVNCDATPPDFAIRVEGVDFGVSGQDLIVAPGGSATGTRDFCLCGIQPGDPGPYILGEVFLKNVIAEFDVGQSKMRFAPRMVY